MKKPITQCTLIIAVVAVIATALLVSCQPAAEESPPTPPSSAALEPALTPAEELVPSQQPTAIPAPSPLTPEEPSPGSAPAEKPSPPTIETHEDLQQLINSNPAEVDNTNLPITPTDKLGIIVPAPIIDIEEYRLTVDGFVEKPLTLTYDDILAYPPVSDAVLLICLGVFADNAEWTGVPVAALLTEAGVTPEATEVVFYARDKYRRTLLLAEVQQEGVFLAYAVNGQTLPREHGYPLRLVAEGKYGSTWVKWVDHIEVR
ncbi:molybdopterin-dependent oxidoreductase [Chloroflexota bacterium]